MKEKNSLPLKTRLGQSKGVPTSFIRRTRVKGTKGQNPEAGIEIKHGGKKGGNSGFI